MPKLQSSRRSPSLQDLSLQDPVRLAALCKAWLGCHSDLILILAPDGRISHVAQATDILNEAARTRLAGAAWRSIWPKDHRPQALAAVTEAQAGRTARFQAAFAAPGDQVRWWDAVVAPVANDAGPELLVLLRDITAFKAEEERRAQARRLEAIGRLVGGVAHDFNNLLTVIISASESLAQDGVTDEERRLGQISVEAAERGAELIRRLLAFSRPASRTPASADGGGAVESAAKLLRRTLPENIRFEVSSPPGLVYCRADRGELEAALLNLCINARDAMPAGGRLHLGGELKSLDIAEAQGLGVKPGAYAVFRVQDSGIGMSAETLSRAIEPFFSTKSARGGSGLGLSTVQNFARAAGGTLVIRSQPGAGTCVEIYIPHAKAAAQREFGLAFPHKASADCDVLVVEDDRDVCAQTVRMLQAIGCRVTAAEDAQGALAVLTSDDPLDLMFTDLQLPYGLNGEELAAAAASLRPDLKVLFTSGCLEEAGAPSRPRPEHFIAKPFSRARLAEAVTDTLLRRGRSAGGAAGASLHSLT